MKQFTIRPDKAEVLAGSGVTVFRNPENTPRKILAVEKQFFDQKLFLFDESGILTEFGLCLYGNKDNVKGSPQTQVFIPPHGLMVSFGQGADPSLQEAFSEIMGDAMLYNATMTPDREFYVSDGGETLTFTLCEEPAFPENALSFLFVGNSTTYFNGCPLKFRAMARAAGVPVKVRYCTNGSAFLHEFASPEHERGQKLRRILKEEAFDYVVLQEAQKINLPDTTQAVKTILPLIAENGAKTLFYARYAASNDPTDPQKGNGSQEQVYQTLSERFFIPYAPVATAYKICGNKYPEINLYADDGCHHSALGSYLIAATWLETYLGKSPVGNPYTAFFDKDSVQKLQECAHEACFALRKDVLRPGYWQKPGSLEPTRRLSRVAAAEGAVLMRNDRDTLPLDLSKPVALFGRMQTDYIKSGTGSGGKVNAPYVVNIRDGLKNAGVRLDETVEAIYDAWIAKNPIDRGNGWFCPWNQEEMPIAEKDASEAAKRNETALYIVGRTAGEDRDCTIKKGSFFLTETEEENIRLLTGCFRKVCVLLNIGSLIDLSWMNTYPVSAAMILWQGGMEGGNACADLLTGKVTPCGKLADTAMQTLADYPAEGHFGDPKENVYTEDIYLGYRYSETFAKDRVLFPFGYGLSYTAFETTCTQAIFDGAVLTLCADVRNTGNKPGKEVVQAYFEAPNDGIGNPARKLIAFGKTRELKPGETETLVLNVRADELCSYDDARNVWLMEKGTYRVYVGTDVRNAENVLSFTSEERIFKRCRQLLAPEKPFDRLTNRGMQPTPPRKEQPASVCPPCADYTGDRGIKLFDVADGKAGMNEFLAQIPDEQLICMVRGEGMNSPKVTAGSASAFGGVTKELLDLGIPLMCSTDGPSGVRLTNENAKATALPNGTLLACTWNVPLIEKLFRLEGIENRLYGIDTILGPGINLHRHPLGGRNFEYFSECPVLTGKICAAALRGLNAVGACGTVKHFFGNSQETNRHGTNAVMSERCARELYVKAFEIAVREGGCRSIMTSYNPVNGVWSACNPDLTGELIREEWGFDGIVMTDWWAKVNADEAGECNMTSLHRMVKAQNDLYMVTPDASTREDDLPEALADGRLSRAELVRCAEHICRFALHTKAFLRLRLGERPDETYKRGNDILTEVLTFDVREPGIVHPYSSVAGSFVLELDLEAKGEMLAQNELIFRVDSAAAATVIAGVSEGRQTRLCKLTMICGEHKTGLFWSADEFTVHSAKLYRIEN
ncbi:MAG: glycoside hydrolase family 3 C-terminal domain-containing protein [Clostridiales bacterium]|nr:glycoside hydrolase family 3 C-terminal domain-containing protein [Candidatus Coliplasma caballi]